MQEMKSAISLAKFMASAMWYSFLFHFMTEKKRKSVPTFFIHLATSPTAGCCAAITHNYYIEKTNAYFYIISTPF